MSFAQRLVLGTVLILILAVLILLWGAERSLRRDLEGDIARRLESEAAADPRGAAGRLAAAGTRPCTGWPRRTATASRSSTDRPRSRGQRLPAGPAPRRSRTTPGRPEVRAGARRAVGRGHPPERDGGAPAHVRRGAGRAGRGPGRGRPGAGGRDHPPGAGRGGRRGAARPAGRDACSRSSPGARSRGRSPSIAAAARAIAAGAPPRFPRSGIPDIDALVQSLRQMHRQLGDRFDELRREQAESAALVESMVEGVIAADGRGRIVTANPAARRLLGYGATEALPDLPELFRVKAAREVVDAVLQGQPVQDRQLEMDGRVFLVNARPLPDRRRRAGAARPHRGPPARGGAAGLRRQRLARAQDPAHLDLGLRRDAAGRRRRHRDHRAGSSRPSSATRVGCSGWWTTCSTSRASRPAAGSRTLSEVDVAAVARESLDRAGRAGRRRTASSWRSTCPPTPRPSTPTSTPLRQVLTNLMDNSLRLHARRRPHHLRHPADGRRRRGEHPRQRGRASCGSTCPGSSSGSTARISPARARKAAPA